MTPTDQPRAIRGPVVRRPRIAVEEERERESALDLAMRGALAALSLLANGPDVGGRTCCHTVPVEIRTDISVRQRTHVRHTCSGTAIGERRPIRDTALGAYCTAWCRAAAEDMTISRTLQKYDINPIYEE